MKFGDLCHGYQVRADYLRESAPHDPNQKSLFED